MIRSCTDHANPICTALWSGINPAARLLTYRGRVTPELRRGHRRIPRGAGLPLLTGHQRHLDAQAPGQTRGYGQGYGQGLAKRHGHDHGVH